MPATLESTFDGTLAPSAVALRASADKHPSLEREPEPDLADALLGLARVAGVRGRHHEGSC